MGSEIVYCHLCGTRILEKDLLAGRALTLLDKTFCHLCKEKAFSQMRTEEPGLEGGGPPTAKTSPLPPPPLPAGAPAAAAPRVALQRPPREPREPLAVRPRRNPLPLYIGGTVGFLAVTALLILLIQNAQKPKDTADKGGPEAPKSDSPTDHPATDAAADAAIKEIDDLVRAGASPDDLIRKCDALAEKLRGSKHETRWMDIRKRAETQRSQSASEQELRRLIESASQMIAADRDYTNYPAVSEKIRNASELARTKHPDLMPEVNELERKYVEPYEDEARKWSDERSDMLRQLEQERRYKDAMRVIDTFPEKYKHSKVWKQLKRQRDDYVAKVGDITKGGTGMSWIEYYRLGGRDSQGKNRASARANYKKALELIPPDWKTKFEAEDKKRVVFMLYDMGCFDAYDAKKAEKPEDKEKLVASALNWFDRSFRDGLFTTACPCHGKWDEHIPKDDDLEEIRSDPRFKDLLKKYGKG